MSNVFEPCHVGGLELRNRFVRSSTMDPFGEVGGQVSQKQVDLCRELAENQVGLILSGMAYVTPDSGSAPTQNAIYDDSFIPGHRALAEAVHEAGGKILLQINHCGAGSSSEDAVGPSEFVSPLTKKPCRAMTVAEIDRVVEDFAAAAVRAQKAGYDGIQLHCAHGYLLSEFINPTMNHRTDEYGGSVENRFRFAARVIAAVREAVGPSYPLWIKINSNIEDGDEGFEPALLWMGQECRRLGVVAIEVSGCDFTPQGRAGHHNYYLNRAKALKEACGLPVILVGGVRTAEDMQQVLDNGLDLVSLCRPFICEPDLVVRLKNGQEKAKCVSCSKCFFLYYKEGVRCVFHLKDKKE